MEICKLIVEKLDHKVSINDYDETPYHIAAKFGQFEVCKYMIEALGFKNPESKRHRTDADIKEVYLSTPFHCAARYGHAKICQLIMDNIGNKNPG